MCLLALPIGSFAQNEPVVAATVATEFDTPAQRAMRAINSKSEAPRPKRVAAAEVSHPDLVARLEEIRVYGRREPEEYQRPKVAPMLQLRARLDRDIPLTPAKRIQGLLCIIGLCGMDFSEPSPETRAELRLQQSTLDSIRSSRGTLQ